MMKRNTRHTQAGKVDSIWVWIVLVVLIVAVAVLITLFVVNKPTSVAAEVQTVASGDTSTAPDEKAMDHSNAPEEASNSTEEASADHNNAPEQDSNGSDHDSSTDKSADHTASDDTSSASDEQAHESDEASNEENASEETSEASPTRLEHDPSTSPGKGTYKGLGDDNEYDIMTDKTRDTNEASVYSLERTQRAYQKGVFQKENLPEDKFAKYAKEYDEAVAYSKNYELDKSKEILENLTKKAPDYRLAWVGLAKVLLRQDEQEEALDVVREALDRFPAYIPIVTLKARILLVQLKFVEAEELLDQYSPPLKGNIGFFMTMAVVEQRLGKYLYAAQIYMQLLQYDDDNGLWWLGAAMNMESAGKNNAARTAYNRALATHTLNPFLSAYASMQIGELQ